MKNTFRKGLTLLMVLCMLVPLFGLPVFAADTDEAMPIDYRFEKVSEDSIRAGSRGLTNDLFSPLQWDMKLI